MAGDALGEPIVIRFDGLDAENHEIEMSALADSLKGLARIIGVTGNFAATLRYTQHKDAFSVRVVVRPPEAHCFELMVWVRWVMENPLISTTVGGLAVALVSYIFKRAAGQREEMKQLRGALDEAIKQLGMRDQPVVDRLLSTIDKMADALRPAARQAVAPLGETARTLRIGQAGGATAVELGIAEKEAILSDTPPEIGSEKDFHILITELDMETGSCRFSFVDEPEARFSGRITDPAFSLPHNPYVLAMAAKRPLTVRAKAAIRDGAVEHLYISDAVLHRL